MATLTAPVHRSTAIRYRSTAIRYRNTVLSTQSRRYDGGICWAPSGHTASRGSPRPHRRRANRPRPRGGHAAPGGQRDGLRREDPPSSGARSAPASAGVAPRDSCRRAVGCAVLQLAATAPPSGFVLASLCWAVSSIALLLPSARRLQIASDGAALQRLRRPTSSDCATVTL
jgi:hypothetical protein